MPAGGRQRGLCMVLAYQHKHKHNGIGRAIVTGVILVPAMPKYVCDVFDKKNNRRYWVGLRHSDRCRLHALSLLPVEQS